MGHGGAVPQRVMATPEILDLSARVIDSGTTTEADGPLNRITNELSELGDGLAMVESFSHSVAFATDDGLVCFDASGPATGAAVVGPPCALGGPTRSRRSSTPMATRSRRR